MCNSFNFKFPFIKIDRDPEQNEMITKYINEAYKLGVAKLDAQNADLSGFGAALNNVKDLVNILLTFGTGLVVPYLSTSILSGVHGLGEGLSEGLSQDGLIGGIGGAVEGLFDGLGTGGITGFSDFVSSLLSSSK